MQPGRTLYFPVQLIISLGEICPKLPSVSPYVDIIIKHIKFSDLIEQIELFLFVFLRRCPSSFCRCRLGRECENVFEVLSAPAAPPPVFPSGKL